MIKFLKTITLEEVKKYLRYEPETGDFYWIAQRYTSGHQLVGKRAGSLTSGGYWAIRFCRKQYQAHRVGWFYYHGKWPRDGLDHINGNKLDNRICNLREATQAQNNLNSAKRKDNKSGFKGVYWLKSSNAWAAKIQRDKKSIFLGLFANPSSAFAAYCAAAKEIHQQFARVK